MQKEKLTAAQRCDLAARTAQWCFDRTTNWEHDHIGEGLAYLLWSIVDCGKVCAFDATLENGADYADLVTLLRLNPNGLLDELVAGEFIVL